MNMKQASAAIAALCCLVTGCGINASPADLLRAPKLDTKQEEVSQAIASYLPPSARLLVPMRPANSSAVNQADLDGDGQDEVIVFFKQERNEYEIGTIILKRTEKGWIKLPEIKGLAQDVDFFTVADITGDGRPEVLIGYRGGEELEREFIIYSLSANGLQEMWKQSYNELAVGDLDADNVAEVAILRHDHEKLISKTELYGFSNGVPRLKAQLDTEGAINGYIQAIIGPAAPGQNGLFIDAGIGAHSAYTALLMMKNGQLVSLFNNMQNETEVTFKAYALSSEDVNGDGIIEIGIQREPAGSEQLSMAEMPWINGWHQWDGKNGLKLVMDTYSDYGAGYEFRIPDNWMGKYTIQRETDMEVGSVSFLYMGTFPQKKTKLLSIYLYKRSDWSSVEEQLQQQGNSFTILAEDKNKLIVAVLPADVEKLSLPQEYTDMLLRKEDIRKYFQLISS